MKALSATEDMVAEAYCHGFNDEEVSCFLNKPVWTVRTHKKHIYQKLGIATTHEIVLFMVCKKIGKAFDLKEIRKIGISALLSCILLVMAATDHSSDILRYRTRTSRTTRSEVRRNSDDLTD